MKFFFFGSLMDRDILETVLDRSVSGQDFVPAFLEGYARVCVSGQDYPVLVSAPGHEVEGVVFDASQPDDYHRIAWFEDLDYDIVEGSLRLSDGTCVRASYCADTGRLRPASREWCFRTWQERDKPRMLNLTRIYMQHFGRMSAEEADALWEREMNRYRPSAPDHSYRAEYSH